MRRGRHTLCTRTSVGANHARPQREGARDRERQRETERQRSKDTTDRESSSRDSSRREPGGRDSVCEGRSGAFHTQCEIGCNCKPPLSGWPVPGRSLVVGGSAHRCATMYTPSMYQFRCDIDPRTIDFSAWRQGRTDRSQSIRRWPHAWPRPLCHHHHQCAAFECLILTGFLSL